MSEIGVGQGAVLSRAEEAALNLTSDIKHNVAVIQAAIDDALGIKKDEPAAEASVEAPAEEAPVVVATSAHPVATETIEVEEEPEEPQRKRRR